MEFQIVFECRIISVKVTFFMASSLVFEYHIIQDPNENLRSKRTDKILKDRIIGLISI